VRSDLHRAAFQPSYRRSELEGVYALSRRSQLLAGRIFRHDPTIKPTTPFTNTSTLPPTSSSKEVHDRDISAPEVRPKSEILNDTEEAADSVEDESFSQEEIVQTTRLARDHAFGHFDSGRASNASYEDTQFSSYRHSWEWFGAEPRRSYSLSVPAWRDYGPHGDTHLRTVKQFDPDELVDGFYETTDRLLSVIASESSFRRPVTAAIDITTIPYYGDVEEMSMVSGTKDRDGRAFKFATLSIIGQNIPLILAVEPVREL